MKSVVFALSAAALVSSSAQAGMVEMRWVGVGLGGGVRVSLNSNVSEVFAGQIAHEFRNGVGAGAQFNGQTIMTYCTEITQHVSADWYVYDVTDIDSAPVPGPAMGSAKADAIRNMLAQLMTTTNLGMFNTDVATGFQVAVWEVVYDLDPLMGRSSVDVTTGALIVDAVGGGALSAGVLSAANMFLDHISVLGVDTYPLAFVNEARQDQIIPTPGSLALAGAGGLLMLRRRRSA